MPYPLPPLPIEFMKVHINKRNSDEYLSWNSSVHALGGPHALIIGPSAPARADVIERLLRYSAMRNIPALVVKPEAGENDDSAFPALTGPLTVARLLRAMHDEFHARAQYVHDGGAKWDELPTLVLTVDGIDSCIRQWNEIAAGENQAEKAVLTSLDPTKAFDELLVLGRSVGIVLLVGAAGTETFAFRHEKLQSLRVFGTRIGLGGFTHDDARAMFNDEIDASEIIVEPTHALVGSETGLEPALHSPTETGVIGREPATPIFTAYSKSLTRVLLDQNFADVVEMN